MATRTDIEDLLHCMICFESYRTPKMLHCGHTFCEECLQGYLQTYQQQRRAQQGKLPCPTCRELTQLPSNGVVGLKNDFKVRKLEEMFRTVNLRQSQKNTCESCRSQKKSKRASSYCTQCSMSYCPDCLEKHNKNPIFKDHRVLDKSQQENSDVFCSNHYSEQVKYLCRTCNSVICTLCIMHTHEGHDITELTSIYKRHQDEIRNLQLSIESKLARLRDKGSELEKLRQLNLKSSVQAEAKIKDRSRELIQAIKTCEEDLLRELRTRRDEKLQKIVQEWESVNFMIAKAVSLQDFATNTSKKNSISLMAIHEELVQRMNTVAEIDTTIPDTNIQSIVTFLPGRSEVKLGRIDDIQGTSDELRNHNAIVGRPRTISNSSSFVKPQLLYCINKVGSNQGEIRDPLGVSCLLGGDIVITEWGNKRLQVFDSVGNSLACIAMGMIGPQGVAITLKGNIMVTDAQNKRLQVFTPGGKSLSKWGLGKFFAPCGLAICPNGNCIVSDIAEHTVSIFQGEKKCIKRFGGKGHAQDKFMNPLYVCAGPNNEVYVSDSDNHCIKVFDDKGNFRQSIGSEGSGDGQFKFPRGITIDDDGHIIVADRNNDRVSLYTTTGSFVRHLLTRVDGIREPYAIAISASRCLVVTESGADRASVKVYQL